MMNNSIAITSYKYNPLVNNPIINITESNYWIKHNEQLFMIPRPIPDCSLEGLANLQNQEKCVGTSLGS